MRNAKNPIVGLALRLALAGVVGLTAAAPASAQFSLERLASEAVNTVVGAAAEAVTGKDEKVAASAPVSTAKPAGWPANVRWYDYGQSAPQPASNGKVKIVTVGDGWGEGLAFSSLPLQHAIVRVHGTGKRKIAMFADPNCPYSRAMERELNKLNDVTIYTFVLPLLGSKSLPAAQQIACQPTNQARAQAYDNMMLNKINPPVVAACDAGITKVMDSIKGLRADTGQIYSEISPFTVYWNNVTTTGGADMKMIREAIDWKP